MRCTTQSSIAPDPCWGCSAALVIPPRMRVGAAQGAQLVMLSPGAQLFVHHLEGDTYNFGAPLAEVIPNPLGLKNLSSHKWTSRTANGAVTYVNPNEVLRLVSDCHIHFGKTEAEVRLT